MFSVNRTFPAPPSLSNRTSYNSTDVVTILENIFHGKCYLCESADLHDPEVEHFVPHEGDDNKKYDWANLYYACSRCNSIKSNKHKDILDCCSKEISVAKAMQHGMPSTPDDDIKIVARINNDQTKKTAELLHDCFNKRNTGIRSITRSALVESLFEHYTEYLNFRLKIISRKSTQSEINDSKERILNMANKSYPHSIFWQWCILEDNKLLTMYPEFKDHILKEMQ